VIAVHLLTDSSVRIWGFTVDDCHHRRCTTASAQSITAGFWVR
jgi:hypothetical protein